MAGANDDLFAAKAAGGAVQQARLDIAHQGGKVKFHVQVLPQVADQRRERLA